MQSEVKRFRAAYSTSLVERQKLMDDNKFLRNQLAMYKALDGLPPDDVTMTQTAYSLSPPQPVPQFANPQATSQQLPPAPPSTEVTFKTPSRGLSKIFKRKNAVSVRISSPITLSEFDKLAIAGGNMLATGPSPLGKSQSPDTPPLSGGRGHQRTESNVAMSSLQSQGMEQSLAAVALQFILRLERVCYDHIHAIQASDSDPEAAPHGHALMGSNINFAHSPLSTSTTSPGISSNLESLNGTSAPGQMDQRTLELLLNLNFQTNNGEYISTMGGPIYGQISVLDAWNLVSSHTKFGKFNLDVLAHVLSPKVVCRGYGPVVEAEDVFNAIEEVCSGQLYGQI
jgi:hypothetical protein